MDVKAKEISLVDIDAIVFNPKNNNSHPDEQIDRLVKIIEHQGFRNPVTISKRSGFLVAGHGRIMAARKLGIKEIPVMYQDFENEAQEYAHMTADNAIQSWSHLDLSAVNKEMLDFGPEFDLDLLGIKDFVIEPIEKFEPQSDEDDVPELKQDPITKRGDVWLLGNHRLKCGDSTMIDDVEKLMNGEKADMVFTDPPYNQSASGGGFLNKGRESRKKLMNSDNLNCFDPEEFMNIWEIIRPQTSYIFCSKNLIKNYIERIEDRNWNLLIMRKRNPIPQKNNTFLADVEYLFCIREPGAYWKNDCHYDYYRRVRDVNVKPSEFGHPTEKQVSFIEPYFEISSKVNDLVVDFFTGSGTTLIACEKTNRKCYGMELDESYCDVIINRWMNYTGRVDVALESTGELYNDLKKSRI